MMRIEDTKKVNDEDTTKENDGYEGENDGYKEENNGYERENDE